ncbi:MAG: hypothetical protein AB1345_12665 [Chloroflexota bacterium]
MLLQYQDGETFATGVAPYTYLPASERETTPRIIISVKIQEIETSAFVDTGGVYAICSPEIAEQLELDPSEGVPVDPIQWRRERLQGVLYRIPITILAQEGVSLTIEATCFIPKLAHWQQWQSEFPCILGMYLCLDRLRFAVDPAPHNEMFHFGALNS